MDCCVAIGGDNYCYDKGKIEWETDQKIKKMGKKLMLWGCSVEPSELPGELAAHLHIFDLITVRDSISYQAFLNNGFDKTKVKLVADSAFLLEKADVKFPKNWKQGQMVGINLSPLIISRAADRELILQSFEKLVEYILNHTEMNIALIPHVRFLGGDDIDALRPLYEKYKHTNRVVLIDDNNLNCSQLKGYIADCRFFVGARTHSIIAAYSSCVPSLALGYSVKAKGIARDIFGSEENLVLPVQTLNDSVAVVRRFEYLLKNEDSLRALLRSVMPQYKEKAKLSGEALKELLER